jgi:predicted HicB family RNase H-like nuclease
MDVMEIHYREFVAQVYFSAETDLFFGEVQNSPTLISFQATHLADVNLALQDAVERYLEYLGVDRLQLKVCEIIKR